MTVIGVDFGTTNSVVTQLDADGTVRTVRHSLGTADLDVIRSVLCFWNDGNDGRVVLRHAAGPAAIEAYLDDPLDTNTEPAAKVIPKPRAAPGSMRPAGMGRFRVRCMIATISRSYHILIAPHAPAATAMHRTAVNPRTGFR